MRRSLVDILLLVALLAAGLSVACGASRVTPAPEPTTDLAAAVVDADRVCHAPTGGAEHVMGQLSRDAELFMLEGGVTALLKRTPGSPVVAVRLYIDGGSRVEDPSRGGVTSLALNVATSGGTGRLSRSQLAARLSAMGSGIGHQVDFDVSALSLSTLDVYFAESWGLFRQVLSDPAFPESEVERLRERQLHAIRSRHEDPDARVVDTARELLFAGHAYATVPSGTEESVTALTRGDLLAAYRDLFDGSRMLLVVVGDLDRSTVEAVVGDTFVGTAASGTRPPRPEPHSAPGVDLAVEAVPLPTNYVLGMAPAPDPADPDYAPLQLALSYLSDRLFEEVRTARNLAYAVSAGISTRLANYSFLYVSTIDPAAALTVMAAEVEALQQRRLTAEAVEEIIAGFTTDYYQGMESNGALASELGWWTLYGGGYAEADAFVARIHAVTPADIQRVANTYLRGYQFGLVGSPDALDAAELRALFAADPS